MHQQNYIKGMREGIPVGLGYFVVSFTIGIAARKANLTPIRRQGSLLPLPLSPPGRPILRW